MPPTAPPLSGTDWLPVDDVVDRTALAGRPAVVLFWSITCEASWVRLRQLERLAARHGDALSVVAVHSPRFDFERCTETVRAATESRRLAVPVLHDPRLESWARFGLNGRPTVVVFDHRGKAIGAIEGIDPRSISALDDILDELVAVTGGTRPRRRASQRRTPDATDDSTDRAGEHGATPLHQLLAPASIARLTDGTVAVADRGRGRLVVFGMDADAAAARVVATFGGLTGIGAIAVHGDGLLAVSFPDRGEVESIDVETKERTIVARDLVRPLGLVEDRDGSLVVADGGADELRRLGTHTGPITDQRRSSLSQPLDVVRIDAGLVFCEASTGALRLLTDRGAVRTLNDGSTTGLIDGPVHRAAFQRPTGLATLDDGAIAIADLGNDRIRLLARRKVSTVPVAGLRRPEAVLYLGRGQLLVADTGHRRLVTIDLSSHTARPLSVDGLPV